MSGGFRSLHPAVLLVYYAGLLVFAAVLFHPLFLGTILASTLVLFIMQGEGRRLLRGAPFYLLIAGSAVLLNPLFSHRGSHILFYLFDQPVTLESVLYGLMTGMTLLSIFLVFGSYGLNLTTDKFMYLFSAAAPKTALLTWMTLRFVPLFQRRLHEIAVIQRTRGVSVHEGGLRKRMRDGMTMVRVLLTWSLEEAMQTADSMKARGYGVRRRSAYAVYKLDRRDVLCLAVLVLSEAVCLGFWLAGRGKMEIYPRMRPMVFGLPEGIMYGAFCLFNILPLIVEGKEKWLWRSSARNISASVIPAAAAVRLKEYRSP